jgi:hypothetical protein
MEPRIWIKRNGDRTSRFQVYDPLIQQHHTFGSETELRVWLDQRYYQ